MSAALTCRQCRATVEFVCAEPAYDGWCWDCVCDALGVE